MAREFTRPELSRSDVKLALNGRVVVINPDWQDVVAAIKAVEKGCRKNKLDIAEAEAAWQQVSSGHTRVAGAGRWSNPRQYHYDMQGTVIVVVRIADALIGLSCERQRILAGKNSSIPFSNFDVERVEEQSLQWFNSIAALFWTHLSVDETADLKQQAAIVYLTASENGFPDAWQRQRASHLTVLQGLQDPVNVTELQAAGRRLANRMEHSGVDAIAWRDLKQQEPSLASRYQRELLEILDKGVLSRKHLSHLSDTSPFRLRFSVWRGAERIFNVPQLVLEVEAYDLLEELRNGRKEQQMVANLIKGSADWQWHPGQSNCVGWIRVHIDDKNRLCFIDEVQSDTVEEVTRYLQHNREILSTAETTCIEQYLQAVKLWHVHGYVCLSQWATDIGYRVGMHSRESAALVKTAMTPSDRKWNTYYGALIKRYALQRQVVERYPAPVYVVDYTSSTQSLRKTG